MDLSPGSIVQRYRLERRIGEGGMGVVWAATHLVTRRSVALKFLKGADVVPKLRARFLREARAASVVKHPNVVQIYDVLETEQGLPFMVMEYLVGESLAGRLERTSRLPLEDLAPIFLATTAAVGTAHAAGIIHRDLKPDNIFLTREGATTVVKVLDFGIAKLTAIDGDAAQTAGLTNTGAMIGTPHYMSPEQAFGEPIDHRADIWSLGIIAYRCLSGVLPTQGENLGQILKVLMKSEIRPLRELSPDLPPILLDLVDRMLAHSPEDRPPDLRQVYDVFAELAASRTGPGFGPPAPTHEVFTMTPRAETARAPAGESRRERAVPLRAIGVGALVAAAAVGALIGSGLFDRDRGAAPPGAEATGPEEASRRVETAGVDEAEPGAAPPVAGAAHLAPASSSSVPVASPAKAAPPRPSSNVGLAPAPPSAASSVSAVPPSPPPPAGGVVEQPPF